MTDDKKPEGQLLPFKKKKTPQSPESSDPFVKFLRNYGKAVGKGEEKKLVASLDLETLRALFLRVVDENIAMTLRLRLLDSVHLLLDISLDGTVDEVCDAIDDAEYILGSDYESVDNDPEGA